MSWRHNLLVLISLCLYFQGFKYHSITMENSWPTYYGQQLANLLWATAGQLTMDNSWLTYYGQQLANLPSAQ
jgi:hypothetical protein